MSAESGIQCGRNWSKWPVKRQMEQWNCKSSAAAPQTEVHRKFCSLFFERESRQTPTESTRPSSSSTSRAHDEPGGCGLALGRQPSLATWDMRAGLELLASPQVTECTQTNSSSKVDTGQSGFICASPIAGGVHGNRESSFPPLFSPSLFVRLSLAFFTSLFFSCSERGGKKFANVPPF